MYKILVGGNWLGFYLTPRMALASDPAMEPANELSSMSNETGRKKCVGDKSASSSSSFVPPFGDAALPSPPSAAFVVAVVVGR